MEVGTVIPVLQMRTTEGQSNKEDLVAGWADLKSWSVLVQKMLFFPQHEALSQSHQSVRRAVVTLKYSLPAFILFSKNIMNRFYMSPWEVWISTGPGAQMRQVAQPQHRLLPSSLSRAGTFPVKLHEFPQFKLGLLQHSDFPNKAIMERMNSRRAFSGPFPGPPGIHVLTAPFTSLSAPRVMISLISSGRGRPVHVEHEVFPIRLLCCVF